MITIQFNGKAQEIQTGTTILRLLEIAGIKGKYCAVERNGDIVPKGMYATTELSEGDQMEVVTLVGGG